MVQKTEALTICEEQRSCMTCPVRHRAVCAHCGPADLHNLEAIRFFHSYKPGHAIVWADERLDFVATVVSGIVSLTRIMADGRTQMVGMLRAGNFLGHPYRAKVAYNAVAATPVVLCGFHRQRFETLLRKTPALSQGLLEQSMGELDAAREWMLLLGRKNAREKVASFLDIFARDEIGQKASRRNLFLDLPFTRAEIADHLGLTLETVSRQFTALRDAGIICTEGMRGVNVLDYSALLAETGSDDDGGWLA